MEGETDRACSPGSVRVRSVPVPSTPLHPYSPVSLSLLHPITTTHNRISEVILEAVIIRGLSVVSCS